MSDINPEQLSKFQKRLKEASRAKPPLYSVEDAVTKSFGLIDQARQRDVPWEDITQMLNESTGKELGVRTVKFYYFKAQKALKDGTTQPPRAPRPKTQSSTRKPKPQAEAEVQDTAQPTAQVSAQAIAPSSASGQTTEQSVTDSHFADFEVSQPDGQKASPQGASVGEWIEPEFNVNRVRPANRPIAV